jgi:beta-lactamase regulating signal transducer with metallopeptidase domain
VTEHLIVSTIILGLAMLAARLLPVTARTRHAMLICAIAKFAVPTALLDTAGVRVIHIASMPVRVFDGTANPMRSPAPISNWMLVVWAALATLFFGRWILLRSRTVAAALRASAPPSQREADALAESRRALGVRTAIDIIRSPLCEAPAVLRVIRPVIVLPSNGCEDLTNDELHALLLHEVAHVSRRDNLTAMFMALAGALLWFHPLVWMALRQIEAAREQASDERVSEAMKGVEPYLEALTKVCRALIAPRTAGVSCMAGANVKERMEHLMGYETLKKRAWSHRGVVAIAAMVVIAVTTIAATPPKTEDLYALEYVFQPYPDRVVFDLNVIEIATRKANRVRVTAHPGEWATVSALEENGYKVEVQIRKKETQPVEAILTVTRGDRVVQKDLYKREPEDPSKYSGEPIDLHLKNADIRDIMATFGEITGTEVQVAPEIQATVSIDVTQMPWDQALMEIAKMTGTKIVIEGKTIKVTK